MDSMEEHSLSKENHKKMRVKLGEIVGSLYMDTIKAKHCKLPRISNDSTANRTTVGIKFKEK